MLNILAPPQQTVRVAANANSHASITTSTDTSTDTTTTNTSANNRTPTSMTAGNAKEVQHPQQQYSTAGRVLRTAVVGLCVSASAALFLARVTSNYTNYGGTRVGYLIPTVYICGICFYILVVFSAVLVVHMSG